MNTKPAVLSEVWDSNPWLFTFIFSCKYLSHEFLRRLFPEILYPPDMEQVFLDIYYQFKLSLKLLAQGLLYSYICCLEYVHRVLVLPLGAWSLGGGVSASCVGSASERITLLRLISAAGLT